MKRRVVITGIGPVSSVGIGKDAFWEGILEKKLNIQSVEEKIDGELWDRFYIHQLKDFDISFIGPKNNSLIIPNILVKNVAGGVLPAKISAEMRV